MTKRSRPMSARKSSTPAPALVEPDLKRLDGVVREASVPPLVAPITHGSLADIPFDNASDAPAQVVLSRKGPDGDWADVTANAFADEVLALAKGLIGEGLMPGDRIAI